MEFPISQKITCKQLVDHICKELPDDLIKEHVGVIRQMRRKQLIFVASMIKSREDFAEIERRQNNDISKETC